jgi:hypothetical protein
MNSAKKKHGVSVREAYEQRRADRRERDKAKSPKPKESTSIHAATALQGG